MKNTLNLTVKRTIIKHTNMPSFDWVNKHAKGCDCCEGDTKKKKKLKIVDKLS